MIIFWIFLLQQKIHIFYRQHLLQELTRPPYLPLAGTSSFPFTHTSHSFPVNKCLCKKFPLLVRDFFGGPCCPQQKWLQKSWGSWGTLDSWHFGVIYRQHPVILPTQDSPSCTSCPLGCQGPERKKPCLIHSTLCLQHSAPSLSPQM